MARTLMRRPRILILDEPDPSLDLRGGALVQEVVNQLLRTAVTEGRTVLFVAHQLSNVVSADNIVVLDHGRIEEQVCHALLIPHSACTASSLCLRGHSVV